MKLSCLVNDIKDQIISVKYSGDLQRQPGLSKGAALRSSLSRRALNININGLAINSKLAKEGYLFFCLSGTHCKGVDFINEACSNGAKAVILHEDIKVKSPIVIIRVKDVIRCLASLTAEFYDYPSDRLNMTAVTGTNGKTTITFAIESILQAFKKKAGVIGTLNYRFGNNVFIGQNTTPDIITINELLKQMLGEKIKFLAMEVSSHALAQRRIEGLKFNQAIFSNLSQDHFDYHKTKRNYFLAKTILFKDYLKTGGSAIVNTDDAHGRKLAGLIKKKRKNKIKVITYGIKNKADITARHICFDCNGSRFLVEGLKHKFGVETNLIGVFNVYNALASIAASLILGIPPIYIVKGLKNVFVPGRLEKIVCRQKDISIFVDYAHTEDGLKNVLLSLNELKGYGKLIVVFGCGGDRDKGKRPLMGKVASELADFTIITSDNPRFEDPESIISDIKKGISRENYICITDRKDAIKKAIDMARAGDIVLVAGKGHEDYQIIKDNKFAFNDRLVVEAILNKAG